MSSAITPIWQIGTSAILDLLNKSNNLFEGNYTQNFMILKLQSVKTADNEEIKKKNKNIPEGIVRHQLMNLFVKVAIDKYCNILKQIKNPLDAVKYGFEQHFAAVLENFEKAQDWRMRRYYNEKVDNFIQAHLPLLNAIYKTWATYKKDNKRERYISLDDFHNICSSIIDKDCPVREMDLYFNQAIGLQENEVDQDRHYYLVLSEFIEAFCRAIDRASTDNQLDLINKLDNIREKLKALIGSTQEFKSVKEKFVLPSQVDGLYDFDKNVQYYREILFPDRGKFSI